MYRNLLTVCWWRFFQTKDKKIYDLQYNGSVEREASQKSLQALMAVCDSIESKIDKSLPVRWITNCQPRPPSIMPGCRPVLCDNCCLFHAPG